MAKTDDEATRRLLEMQSWCPDDLLTPDDVGKLLKVSPRTVMKFLRDSSLKGSKIGKFWRIKRGDLDNFIDGERGLGGFKVGNRGVHASGDIRDLFYNIIENMYNDDKWLDSKKNRAYTRRVAGRMWMCTDILPSMIRDELGDISNAYLRDYDRGQKIGNCSQVARLLLDILDSKES